MRAHALAVVSVVVLGILVACGGDERTKTPAGGRVSCHGDSDCAVTDHRGCCNACADQPFAMPADEAARLKNKCAAAPCASASDRIECPKVDPTDAYVAICKEGTCAARKK